MHIRMSRIHAELIVIVTTSHTRNYTVRYCSINATRIHIHVIMHTSPPTHYSSHFKPCLLDKNSVCMHDSYMQVAIPGKIPLPVGVSCTRDTLVSGCE